MKEGVDINQNIDVLEPYENELLFSWILRMAEWYGFKSLSVKVMKPFLNMLFSSACRQLPMFYIPEQLDHLVKTINLPKSKFFNSSNSIIDRMTAFPFYSTFLSDDAKLIGYQSFDYTNNPNYVEHIFNIRQSENYYEKALNIKFCIYCIQENNSFYLNREHQIQENFVCYKHNERLKYLEYNKRTGKSLNIIWRKKYTDSQYYLSEKEPFLKVRFEVAKAIHKIFQINLVDSNTVIKSKLRKKLRKLGYLDKNHYYFLDIEKFWHDFSGYNMLSINNKQLFRILFSTSKEVNPVAYITLILFLFETLDEFIKFEIDTDEIMSIIYFKNSQSLLIKPKHGTRVLDDYNYILREKHNEEFDVIGIEDNGYIRVKHKKCGHTWPIFINYLRDFKECPLCRGDNNYLEITSLIKENGSEYELLNMDLDNKKNILILHKTCGRELSIPIKCFKKGQRCFHCLITNKYKKKVYDLVNNEYSVLNYEGTKKKATFLHNLSNCIYPFDYSPINFIKLRHCPSCGMRKNFIDNRVYKSINALN